MKVFELSIFDQCAQSEHRAVGILLLLFYFDQGPGFLIHISKPEQFIDLVFVFPLQKYCELYFDLTFSGAKYFFFAKEVIILN